MKNILLIIVLLCGGSAFAGEQLPSSQRIYSQVVYEVSTPGKVWGKASIKSTNLLTGTFWVLQGEESPVIVTAAHNLALGPRGTPGRIGNLVIGKDNKLTGVRKDVVLGTMGYKPSSVALLGQDSDIALLKSDQEVYKGSKQFKISVKPPVFGQSVTVHGYPGTSHEKVQQSRVVAVYPKFFVLNDPVHHGFSGGVVLNDQGEAMGMINATEEKQATALLIGKEVIKTAVWKSIE